jgi:hypothetical protein
MVISSRSRGGCLRACPYSVRGDCLTRLSLCLHDGGASKLHLYSLPRLHLLSHTPEYSLFCAARHYSTPRLLTCAPQLQAMEFF